MGKAKQKPQVERFQVENLLGQKLVVCITPDEQWILRAYEKRTLPENTPLSAQLNQLIQANKAQVTKI